MKKGLIKVVVLLAVFCFGILGFGLMMNHSNRDLTTEMADATLPARFFICTDRQWRWPKRDQQAARFIQKR